MRINAFYVSYVFYEVNACVSNACVSFVFYAVNACVSFVFAVHPKSEDDSYRLQVVPDVYQIKEFHFLPMSPSLL